MTPADVSALVDACTASYDGDARALLEDARLGQSHREAQSRRARNPRIETPAFVARVDELRAKGWSQRRIAKWITSEFGDVAYADPFEAVRARVRRCLARNRDESRAVSR